MRYGWNAVAYQILNPGMRLHVVPALRSGRGTVAAVRIALEDASAARQHDAMPSSASGSAASAVARPRPRAWSLIAMLAAAVAIGLAANHAMRVHLGTLEKLAATDQIAARAALAAELRFGGLAIFASVCALGASLVVASLRSMRDERFPPAGVWGFSATRIITGPAARRAAQVGLLLAGALIACSLAGAWLSWEMGTRLLACRAGVPRVAAGEAAR